MADSGTHHDLGLVGYEDAQELGRGGFGIVYRAKQTAFDREVAVKVLIPLGIDEAARRRFERECKAMGSLSWHPNILTIYDAGTTRDGRLYLTMELAPDGSLDDRLSREGALPWQDVATIGTAMASALQAAHDSDVMHCDVKPANILTTRAGDVALGDFGIAAVQNATHTRTSTTASVTFAAPEIIDGDEPSVSADLYSLGATLFALLNGKPAFTEQPDESIVAVMKRVATDPVPDLRTKGVPPALSQIVERTMSKTPTERFADAAALGEALDAVDPTAVSQPVPAPADPKATRVVTRRASQEHDDTTEPAIGAAPAAERTPSSSTHTFDKAPSWTWYIWPALFGWLGCLFTWIYAKRRNYRIGGKLAATTVIASFAYTMLVFAALIGLGVLLHNSLPQNGNANSASSNVETPNVAANGKTAVEPTEPATIATTATTAPSSQLGNSGAVPAGDLTLANEYAAAFTSRQWNTVRALNPQEAGNDDNYFETNTPTVTDTFIPLGSTTIGLGTDNVYGALVAQEPGRTVLYCSLWTISTVNRQVVANNSQSGVSPAGTTPADLAGTATSICPSS